MRLPWFVADSINCAPTATGEDKLPKLYVPHECSVPMHSICVVHHDVALPAVDCLFKSCNESPVVHYSALDPWAVTGRALCSAKEIYRHHNIMGQRRLYWPMGQNMRLRRAPVCSLPATMRSMTPHQSGRHSTDRNRGVTVGPTAD